MGSFFTTPESLNTHESIDREANRLLHSYSYLLKGISEKGNVNKVDVMKQGLIHQQWTMVFPRILIEKKEYYRKKFLEYESQFKSIRVTGLSRIEELEEKLID